MSPVTGVAWKEVTLLAGSAVFWPFSQGRDQTVAWEGKGKGAEGPDSVWGRVYGLATATQGRHKRNVVTGPLAPKGFGQHLRKGPDGAGRLPSTRRDETEQ